LTASASSSRAGALIYELGPDTARRQARALALRLLVDELRGEDLRADEDPLELVQLLPEHARCLYACLVCKRVANAHADDGGSKWHHSFNELGTSGSMIALDSETHEARLHCAKRSSASLRSAVAFEEQMTVREVESEPVDARALRTMTCDVCNSGVSARVRRDSKNAFEQRVCSVACGTEPMLVLPIVGRAVRLWNEWYALCSYCGGMVHFHASNRVGCEICCRRCDYKMLHRRRAELPAAQGSSPVCRFCGKRDPMRTGAKWKFVRAPLDATGENANLPPPLRAVFFCPQHFRPWIPGCCKTMPMRVILSHIVFGAKPCFSEAVADEADNPPRKRCKTVRSRTNKRNAPALH